MTTSTEQPRGVQRPERRIIERPRLIKLLDESEARIILLLAPAGYGKTTLARQWFKTLNKAIWISLTTAHRDVATLSRAAAVGIDGAGGSATAYIDEYVRAASNPQRAAPELGAALAHRLEEADVSWLAIDDLHVIDGADEANETIEVVRAIWPGRLLVTSRTLPTWATSREVMYGSIQILDQRHLAMTNDEALVVVGSRTDANAVAQRARGWPALLALASRGTSTPPIDALPDALHDYVAEELYRAAPDRLQKDLLLLALIGDLSAARMTEAYGPRARQVLASAREAGFITAHEDELHPLVREFLLTKLKNQGSTGLVRHAIEAAIRHGDWNTALELTLRFELRDLVEDVFIAAFRPLLRSGRIGTLAEFAQTIRHSPVFPPPAVDLGDAEVAIRDGYLDIAVDVTERFLARVSESHPLAARAHAIRGQAFFFTAAFEESRSAWLAAESAAIDEEDELEALRGYAITAIFGETGDARRVSERLRNRKHRSPLWTLRHATIDINLKRFEDGIGGSLGIAEAQRVLPLVEDPRARTSYIFTAAGALAQRAEYRHARELVDLLLTEIDEYSLDFTLPHAQWLNALVSLGQRRFGEAERLLQFVEDAAKRLDDETHIVNAHSLRARLLLQRGQLDEALRLLSSELAFPLIPSWRGEYLATKALALACSGRADEAIMYAMEATAVSTGIEVRGLAAATEAVAATSAQRFDDTVAAFGQCRRFGAWDPMVTALRTYSPLAKAAAWHEATRPMLEALYARSGDRALAKSAGFRTRDPRRPQEILSPRELEILGLIRSGLRTREISAALFIAESTTKVHIRHIFEKLGVRTRAEAVARYEMFNDAA